MQIGVKFLACRVDSGNVLALEVFHKLVVDEVHALLEAVQVAVETKNSAVLPVLIITLIVAGADLVINVLRLLGII